ncbi:DedA family protein [Streptomyces griseoincarnatus]|uniref:DedA family protein n=1 Tax=Streptomyces griseoincarnatus TaxID=29305 RepID=A0ABT0VQA4_STRGI|nr:MULTISPECIES: DedA family protein [Streptomyces]MBJ6616798.1 DedA family protein [Streptomyces sp. I3(2020)]MBJ6628573.1 DedA family protein [Streptomyces sp. I4(2020)]MCM2512844.1 DedA family protein [Streptomyces griseoincarnatus]
MTAIAAQTITAASGTDAGPQWVNDLMDALGAPGAGIAIALENLFPPVPSEVILPLAGFAASNGRMGLIAVLLWTTVGSVVGALALYGVGALLGRERTLALAARLPLVKVSDVEKTEAWFLRHGSKAVFFGRMIPLFRSLVSIPAGVERMPLPLFLGLTTLGSAIWNTAFVLAGYALGDNWTQVTSVVSTYSKVVLAAAALALVAFVVIRLFRSGGGSRRAGRGSASRDSGSRDAGAHSGAESGAGGAGTADGASFAHARPARSAADTRSLRRPE